MATSVDTNVITFLLLDADATKADAAQRGLEQALARGRILVCGPVFSELLAAGAWDAPTLRSSLADMV